MYDQIVKAANENRNEIIGLLIGNLENNTLVIDDFATGEFSGEPHRVVLSTTTIARIADDILKGRLKGNIVGWYHSHTEGGVFFSQTDADTQKRFQQFSPLTVGMVADARSNDVGFFRIDTYSKPIKVPQDQLRVYEERVDASPARHLPQIIPQPTKRRNFPTRIATGIALIALVASLAFLGGVLYRGSSPALPIIHHSPILTAIVGSPITIIANATDIGSMTLFYASGGNSFTQVPMISSKPRFQYTIAGSQVMANLTYYMEGLASSGVKITTPAYQVQVSDFAVQLGQGLTVYRNATNPTITELSLISINGFSNAVTLSATGMPSGLSVAFSSQDIPGTVLEMRITANANTPLQKFPLLVSASYPSTDSQVVRRTSRIIVTVTDFDIKVSQLTLLADSSGQASFTLNVSLGQEFAAPVKLTLIGLPEDAKIQLAPLSNTIQLTGPAMMAFNIQLTSMKQGTYTVVVTAIAMLQNGDSISHSQTIQLIVR